MVAGIIPSAVGGERSRSGSTGASDNTAFISSRISGRSREKQHNTTRDHQEIGKVVVSTGYGTVYTGWLGAETT